METIINLIVFFIILGVIIMIHEAGHFVAAKFFGVFCSEFSLGMGPKIFSRKKGETEYEIRALPIGGFVAMAGEVDQEDNEDMKDVPYERTLKGIKTWKKCIIMLAGVFMNFVLALVLLIGVFISTPVTTGNNAIGTLVDNGPAMEAGLKPGDKITNINIKDKDYEISKYTDITETLSNSNLNLKNKDITAKVTVLRKDKKITKDVKVDFDKSRNTFLLGITQSTKRLSFFDAIAYGFNQFGYYTTVIFATLGKLITDSGNTIKQLSGPVGIYNVTAQVTQSGQISTLLQLTALLSANIGVFNLLPIPGLDGCQVLFALIERVINREIPTRVKYILQIAGLALVFGLMIYVTVNDVSKLF